MNANLPSFFKVLISFTILLSVHCFQPVESSDEFRFTVVNVGEGLAQIGTINDHALIWDIGPIEGYQNLLSAYHKLGNPFVEKIIISHSDLDHCGGLTLLDSTINWSGNLVVNPFEDTTYLRMLLHKWQGSISFTIIHREGTLKMDNLLVNCLWPPDNITFSSDTNRNTTSLVFSVKYGRTGCLLPSDIDSSVQKQLLSDTFNLHSDILVAPHHGSNNFSPLFIQSINPTFVVVSCSDSNNYGHPSINLLQFLISLKVSTILTYSEGTSTFFSNEFYFVIR